jgi:hypothetical protein
MHVFECPAQKLFKTILILYLLHTLQNDPGTKHDPNLTKHTCNLRT